MSRQRTRLEERERPLLVSIVCGFSDLDNAGNQTLKNSIKCLADFGYEVHMWSFFPARFPNLLDPKGVFPSSVTVRRLPSWTFAPFLLAKRVKDCVSGRVRRAATRTNSDVADYYADDNGLGRLIYVIFTFLVYLPVEVIRVGLAYLGRRPPDVFYGLNWQGAVAARVLSRVYGRPLVTRFHGTTLLERDLRDWRRRLLQWDEIVALKTPSSAVVMTNDGTRGDRILRALGVDGRRVHFWVNGVDDANLALPAGFDREEWRRRHGLKGLRVLLVVSRLVAWKRVDRGIRCLADLKRGGSHDDVVLLVVGDGPERPKLERLAEELGVRKSVRFAGALPHADVASYFASADVFLALYDVSNLSNPLLEAIHFGVPVVTIHDGSTDGLLDHDVHAVIVPRQGMEEALATAVSRLLDDEPERERLRRNLLELADRAVRPWHDRMRLEADLIERLARRT